jgi:hypothetical protein
MMVVLGEIHRATDGRPRRRVGLAARRQRSFSIVGPASADSALINEAIGRPVASRRRRFSTLGNKIQKEKMLISCRHDEGEKFKIQFPFVTGAISRPDQ